MKRDDHCKHCWQMNGSLLDDMLELPLRAEARVALGFMLSQQEIEGSGAQEKYSESIEPFQFLEIDFNQTSCNWKVWMIALRRTAV